ncbi:MAG: hypothetical protein JWM51_901 [Microbacteriaceae bacterium]|nr:hypothetical protein [Microbacteriaceae bacterium]
MRHTFTTMGTVASLETADTGALTIPSVEAIFRDYDAHFSLYRPDSELSRIASGSLALRNSTRWTLDTYGDALSWRERTSGAFTPHRPDGVMDLNGIVKALAIRDAGCVLAAASGKPWCLNVGGDVLADGTEKGAPWDVGIADPADRTALLTVIELTGTRRAVATSGDAERGDHIWRGGSRERPEFSQVTVVADEIVAADVLATAIMAGGRATLDELTDTRDIDVLTVTATGDLMATPKLRLSH